ncbi:MAG TPA: hypothetical protein VJV96_15520 [Candidatus Angelobacter sp.]|nr:hypothetical protein [Candidatus Angelobacter sp.]
MAVRGVDWHDLDVEKNAILMPMSDTSDRRADFHQSGFSFVNAELDTGLTFARIALGAKGRDKVDRNRVNARKAYDSAMHFLPSTSLNTEEAGSIKEKISALQAALTRLGEVL